MGNKRIGPEAKIISLFTALPDESKRIVLDVIRAQSAAPRKVATKKAATPTQSDKDAKCAICGNTQDHSDHDRSYLKSHDFEGPKSVARAGRRSSRKDAGTSSTPNTASEAGDAIAAGATGD